ncbi:MAG: UvrB/UvrC motif-containing protein [Pirellulaceae bacterium]|jgi:protein arginine kinase activator
MKCMHCEKPATFHITELTDPQGPVILHLCEDHAREFLAGGEGVATPPSLAQMVAQQLQLEPELGELEETDRKECPVCGMTFADFRKSGRLGCPYDYTHFREQLEPLLTNIHGASAHRGRKPNRAGISPEDQQALIQLRRQMQQAIEQENYEQASQLRDQIKGLEEKQQSAQ